MNHLPKALGSSVKTVFPNLDGYGSTLRIGTYLVPLDILGMAPANFANDAIPESMTSYVQPFLVRG